MSSDKRETNRLWKIEPLAGYEAPSAPTHETFRKKFAQLLRRLRPAKQGLAEVNGALKTAPSGVLDQAAPRPVLRPFFTALDAVVDEWLSHREPKHRILVVALPACDEFDLMRTWAQSRQAEAAPDPTGESIMSGDLSALPNLGGDALLVIPKLERWFRRHHSGLALIRELIARLGDTERRCVIGVNSWAWAYLTKAAAAAIELPPPVALAPFDAQKLCVWLSDLAESAQPRGVVFRSDGSGDIIFDPAEHCSTNGKAGNGNGRGDFLKRLAAISRGSPWLAWHIFRDSMRVVGEDTETRTKPEPKRDDPRDTVWIDPVAEVSLPELPKAGVAAALLVLHALLLHGELSMAELRSVLPAIDASHVVHRLAEEKVLLDRKGKWRVAPAGYPAVRDALSHAGFPIDQL